MVTWNPGAAFSTRPTMSAPECGAPITNTGWVTLRELTMRRWRAAGILCLSWHDAPLVGAATVFFGMVAQVQRCLHQRDVAERLRHVADQPAVTRVVLLAEQPDVIAQ